MKTRREHRLPHRGQERARETFWELGNVSLPFPCLLARGTNQRHLEWWSSWSPVGKS